MSGWFVKMIRTGKLPNLFTVLGCAIAVAFISAGVADMISPQIFVVPEPVAAVAGGTITIIAGFSKSLLS
jgi:hypothetical protein